MGGAGKTMLLVLLIVVAATPVRVVAVLVVPVLQQRQPVQETRSVPAALQITMEMVMAGRTTVLVLLPVEAVAVAVAVAVAAIVVATATTQLPLPAPEARSVLLEAPTATVMDGVGKTDAPASFLLPVPRLLTAMQLRLRHARCHRSKRVVTRYVLPLLPTRTMMATVLKTVSVVL